MKLFINQQETFKEYSIIPVNNINVYDLLKYEKLIITKDAVSKIEEVYA